MTYRCDYDDDFFDDSGEPEYDEDGDEGYEEEQEEDDPDYDDPEDGDNDVDDGSGSDLTGAWEDYQEDDGDWSAADYEASAERLFGDNPFLGETIDDQLADEGFQFFDDPEFAEAFERTAPGSTETVRLYEQDGQLHAFGFIPLALMSLLRNQYGAIDFSNLRASLPLKGELAEPKPLPPSYAAIEPKPEVDLRPVCTPVGDQGDTARCSAFAWTHAIELTRRLEGLPERRLAPNYTMLQFQRMQGDAQDYRYAYEGGSGTVSGTDPGEVLVNNGTCRQDLWPDHSEEPAAPERQLAADAVQHRIAATPHPISLDDVKTVLSAGCPVHVGMNTGPAFTELGRDGMISAAEPPSGRHGRHAMLLVGYKGNFFIAKNSWGSRWGDQGYCYIPKSILQQADAEFIAMLRPVPHRTAN
jgi:hypothetical protein